MTRIAALQDRLASINQDHLLHHADSLSEDVLSSLLDQIESLNFEQLPTLIEQYVLKPESFCLPDKIEPPKWYPRDCADLVRPYDGDAFVRLGEDLIRNGKVAAFCVAGGQGTRLGWDAPKGTYPATPILKKSLFEIFAESILATQVRYDRAVPWYIMTSTLNHGPTVAYFNEHNYFGLDPQQVKFFPQGHMPSFDMITGQMLMADSGNLAFNPDGHGGSILALYHSGAIREMKEAGITQISYFQVDNPAVKVIDPLFLGLHAGAADSSGEMSSKMLPKTGPFEKLGNFCKADGQTAIIEYSDLPDELAELRDDQGELQFKAGSIAVHAMSVDFVERLNTENKDGFSLPWHRAVKKVSHFNPDSGQMVEPVESNAVKLEAFVFDALPLCESSIILETDRVEEFAPIKNREGVDSAESSRMLQIERAARWLEAIGMDVPRTESGEVDATIEIRPLSAQQPADLKATADLPKVIEREGQYVI